MNILALDINERSLIESFFCDDYYGGSSAPIRALLKSNPNFYIGAREKSLIKCPPELEYKKVILSEDSIDYIRNGGPLTNVLDIDFLNSVDIVFHPFADKYLNLDGLRAKQLPWMVGFMQDIHPEHRYLALFDRANQRPIIHRDIKIFEFTLGIPITDFQERHKEDLMFACSRLTPSFQTIELCQLCNKYQIPLVLGGPIDHNYPVREHFGKYVEYLGVIDSVTKLKYNSISKLCPQIQNFPISATLAGKEAANLGGGLLVTDIGGWSSFVKNGVNGFKIRNERDFVEAWERRDEIKQIDCYNEVKNNFGADKMTTELDQIFLSLNN